MRRKRRIRGKRVRKMWDIFLPGWKKANWNYIEDNIERNLKSR